MVKRRIKNVLKNLYWGIYGRTVKNPELPSHPTSFLFLCHGNICRSPFAAGIAERLVQKQEDFRFSSAGLHVKRQSPSPKEAVLAARHFGVDLKNHLSRKIDFYTLDTYDMILAMEAGQFRHLKKIFTHFQDKIFLLPLFETDFHLGADRNNVFNIEDPFDKPMDVYLKSYSRIKNCVEGLFGYTYKQ
jgi:protein-tyrosine phosphatase